MIKLSTFKEEHLDALNQIMKRAFDEDSLVHLTKTGGPIGYDNGELLKKIFVNEKNTSFLILRDTTLIGGVSITVDQKTNINVLNMIFIDSNEQNSGAASSVWKALEKKFNNAKVWRCQSNLYSTKNMNFLINKCGFRCTRIKNPKSKMDAMCIMDKWMPKKLDNKEDKVNE